MKSPGENIGSHGLDHDERIYLIDAMYRIVGQLDSKFEALRVTDLTHFAMIYAEVSKRLEGFPERYATKIEAERIALALSLLEKSALSREVYEERHNILKEEVDELERQALPRSVYDAFLENYRIDTERATSERAKALPRVVFETFLDNYRLDQQKATADRLAVVETLGHATNQVRDQMVQERGEFLSQETYDQRHQALVQQVASVQAWQYKLVGGLVFATFVAPLVTGLIVYLFSKEF